MAILQMAEKIKQVHPNSILLFKSGIFYYVYRKDAYIIASIFDYSIKYTEDIPTCGFSDKAINRVKAKLEEKKIDYLVIDPRNNYDVDEESNNRNLNTYEKEFEIAYKNIKKKRDIQKIVERLEMYIGKNEFKIIIRKMEDILDEEGKI